ncbi:F0F1 ATP synthase subunit B family protein [Kiloniella sp. b19]|uniref:F0F1 ATP synthase subunit B family protein n=1 Tax=Kiloniella sp. GXU_MW_B19 TaxID=3141326 RepID=UPI0031DA8CE0
MLASTTFWVGVAFFAFLALVVVKGGKSILGMLDARSDAIRKTLSEAQDLHEEAQKTLAEYKRKQRDALKEAEDIIEHAKAEAARLRKEAEAELEVTLKRREQQAADKIAQAEAAALQEVRNAAVDVAMAATRNLLETNMSKAKGKALLDEAIEELPGKFH